MKKKLGLAMIAVSLFVLAGLGTFGTLSVWSKKAPVTPAIINAGNLDLNMVNEEMEVCKVQERTDDLRMETGYSYWVYKKFTTTLDGDNLQATVKLVWNNTEYVPTPESPFPFRVFVEDSNGNSIATGDTSTNISFEASPGVNEYLVKYWVIFDEYSNPFPLSGTPYSTPEFDVVLEQHR